MTGTPQVGPGLGSKNGESICGQARDERMTVQINPIGETAQTPECDSRRCFAFISLYGPRQAQSRAERIPSRVPMAISQRLVCGGIQ